MFKSRKNSFPDNTLAQVAKNVTPPSSSPMLPNSAIQARILGSENFSNCNQFQFPPENQLLLCVSLKGVEFPMLKVEHTAGARNSQLGGLYFN